MDEERVGYFILFRGRPGVGKTAISTAYSESENLAILRKDDIYDSVFEHVESHENCNQVCQGVLFNVLKSNASSQCTIVRDYPFHADGQIEYLIKFCDGYDVNLISILVVCSDKDLWRSRLAERKNSSVPSSKYQI